ncbi:hypothetical protein SAMN03159489_04449 [Pseudomonas sp. NFPP07]|uniref:hypothetical protein n=1 Tax=Pseudomonas sp. NFPP07 TaxID=1566213 RepID=UPI0008E82E63|nr:hypothetical protein [Pseudomonas sp. NFPP07]SFQ60097.1 hypothetical protein SAMN03159489_04449 [Pseudomonas sp. NFPP07]
MYARIDPSRWKITETVAVERRDQLLNAPDFQVIVDRLVEKTDKILMVREHCCKSHDYFRVVATLHCTQSRLVDFFHNANTGYRAQYLESPSLGDAANAYCSQQFASLVEAKVRKKLPGHWSLDWASESIHSKCAKSWIYQGLWIRNAREDCEDLKVDAWSPKCGTDKDKRRKARYGRQLPGEENRIVLKGGWISIDLKCLGSLKSERANDIHRYGFT